jgi:flagellar protein FliS
MGPKIDLTYQRVAVQNASAIGLTILLYDRLVVDIQSAIAAMQKSDIAKRCEVINHAYLILGQLESNLNMEEGGETATSLAAFYFHVRAKLLEAQGKNSPKMLQEQIELILEVRSAWYQVESQGAATAAQEAIASPQADQPSPALRRSCYDLDERQVSSWSA